LCSKAAATAAAPQSSRNPLRAEDATTMLLVNFHCSSRHPRFSGACNPPPFRRYKGREAGGGRATRQPGQVRKEAALTSSGSGRSSTSYALTTVIAPGLTGRYGAYRSLIRECPVKPGNNKDRRQDLPPEAR